MLVRTIEEARAYRAQINNVSAAASDSMAAANVDLFDPWRVGVEITQAMIDAGRARYRYEGAVYKALQPHTTQADWTPDATPSLWARLDVEHSGTLADPIPAALNMEYFEGLYYSEAEAVYYCFRSTEIPVAYMPSQLVGTYFNLA